MSELKLTNNPSPVATPEAGRVTIYAVGDQIYYKDDAGNETGPVGVGGGGAAYWFEKSLELIHTTGSVEITGSLSNGVNAYAQGVFSHAEGTHTFTTDQFSVITSHSTVSDQVTVDDDSYFSPGDVVGYIEQAGGNNNQFRITVVVSMLGGNVIQLANVPSPIQSSALNALTEQVAGGQSVLFNLSSGNSNADYSHAEGSYTVAAGINSHSEGRKTAALGQHSHAEGVRALAEGPASHAEGQLTTASGQGSHAEGESTNASGDWSHAEGSETNASGDWSHAEGGNTTASGQYSHAEGEGTEASGDYSHAEGESTFATGDYSHAESRQTTASGDYSHAEGQFTNASGYASHAEGELTTASGQLSHAEGFQTTASGDYSHAEGESTTASGNYSHAEGDSTTASGYGSHAEGLGAVASGTYSHAEGIYTIASGSYQHVQGKYNQRNNNFSLFVIGDGTGQLDALRSDIVRVNSGSSGGQGIVEVTGSLAVSGTNAGGSTFTAYTGLRYFPDVVTILPFTASLTDYIVAVSSSNPTVATNYGVELPSSEFGRTFVVKDISGSAAASNITVTAAGSTTLQRSIDGASSYVISINRGSATFVYFGDTRGWGTV